MASWGHSIRRATDDEMHYRWAPDTHLRCSSPNCDEPGVYKTCYSYVTGRGGRVSYAERLLCPLHALRYCKQHQIDTPIETNHD